LVLATRWCGPEDDEDEEDSHKEVSLDADADLVKLDNTSRDNGGLTLDEGTIEGDPSVTTAVAPTAAKKALAPGTKVF